MGKGIPGNVIDSTPTFTHFACTVSVLCVFYSSSTSDPLMKLSKFIGKKNIGSRNVHEFIPAEYQEIMSRIITRTALVNNPYDVGDRAVDLFTNELAKEPKMEKLLAIPGIRHILTVAYCKKRSDVVGTFWSNVSDKTFNLKVY